MSGQSNPLCSEFSAAELEFLAEDEMIEIVPNMKMGTLNFICGDLGPFHPQLAAKVPLWLAVALKKRGKCTIQPPEWMSVDKLTQVLEAERDDKAVCQPLPFHYVEISRLLFDHARDDIADVYMVRSLIEDIKDVRFHKIGTGLEKISERTSALKFKNVSAMEVNIVRPFVVKTLETFYKLDSPDGQDVADRGGSTSRRVQPPPAAAAANTWAKRPLKPGR
ncbi:DNA replication complex GINS protein PSF2 [Impatiens glandulifera]|uniref:DNA replication complex GINS protein PSF2 n=1 Tax=Impatiens glandulifera TaxID=253017 RepID=UPI001FB0930E|nr:DNA replication complex GINS protein PSF2 [Impatiens glandulifera]